MQLPSRPNICTFLRMFFTWSASLLLLFLILGGIFPAQAASITLVQHASKDAGITSSSSLSFPANNTAGDWIAVCIRAGKSGQVLTVKDSNGNTYRTAFQFSVTADTPNGETVAIFYAENIAGGANTVTISESIASNTLRFAILEFSGVATANSLDVAVGAQGTSASPNSGTATTTANGDLLLGVGVTANGETYTAGTGFVIEDRVPATPNTKLITESQIQSTAGPASASASLGASDIWGAALAAFKAASAGSLPPSITSLNPTSGPVGTSVTITGANFAVTQGASTVTFNNTAASPTAWSATSITVPVPPGATSGNVIVTVGGLASNGVNFTVLPAPGIASLNPSSGPITSLVTIIGANFGTIQGSSTVTFNGASAGVASSWSSTSITVAVPSAATTGNVVVAVGGVPSNGLVFTIGPDVTPPTAPIGLSAGTGPSLNINLAWTASTDNVGVAHYLLEQCQGVGCTNFTPDQPLPGNTLPQASVGPLAAGTSYSFRMRAQDAAGNVSAYSNIAIATTNPVGITLLNPLSGVAGTLVTISGGGFGSSQGTSTVTFNGTLGTPASWSDTQITVPVPAGATTGSVVVTASGQSSNGVLFTVSPPPPPSISSLSPTSGFAGTSVTITGTNFGQSQGTSAVTFNGIGATPTSWSTTSIVVPVPSGASTGNVVVTVGAQASNGLSFTVTSPNITSLSVNNGPVGTPITIAGTNFGTSQGISTVAFNGTPATPTSWTPTSIVAPVPAGATNGNVVVTVGGVASNGIYFAPNPPNISALNPTSGLRGSLLTITGTSFGASQGTSIVSFAGVNGTPTSWSDTNITVPVPAGAAYGNDLLWLVVHGVASNQVIFPVLSPSPSISSLNPSAGLVGTSVTISGTSFGATQGASIVTFNGTTATPASWSDKSIVVPVPTGATTGNVVITVGGLLSNGVNFTVTQPPPTITSLSPSSGPIGTPVILTGTNFGASQGPSLVMFNAVQAVATSWSDTSITALVPPGGTTGNVVVNVGGANSNGVAFVVTPSPPNISSLNPTSGPIGTTVIISGTNLGTQATGTVTFNGTVASPTSWINTAILAPVPSGATTGPVVVTVGGQASNGVPFTVIPPAAGIKLVQHASKDAGVTTSSSLAFPASNSAGNWIAVCIRAGKAGQVISVSDSRGNTYHQAVLFNMTVDSDTLGVFYAENIAGGANTITVSDTISTGTLRFAILEYSGIATANSLDGSAAAEGVSVAPSSGNVPTTANGDLILGTILTANPATFTAGSGFLIEATVPAEPNSKVIVEDGVQSLAGPVSGTASLASSDSWGAAIAAFKSAGGGAGGGPTITSLSPTSGPVGTAVTITGANFGSSQGSSTATFNGTLAAPTSWSATSIGVPVPAGATTGNVVVAVGGIQSNGVNFTTGPISVTVSPSAPTVAAGTTQSLTASVQNDPSSLGVSWSLSGTGCIGAACGTVSSITPTSVLYAAPNTAPNPANVSVVATSVTDNTKSATASVTIGPPPPIAVSVAPATSTVSVNLTQTFTATVQYDFSNQGVNWTLSGAGCTGTACGTLTNPTSNGSTFGITYTAPSAVPAPATVIIAATSVADSSKSGSSTITVSQGIPTSLGWFQIPNTLLQPVCPNIPQIQGAIGCQGVIAAWNGGIADTNRNRLLFTGGGHQNYWGNEVYSLNLVDLTLTRINNPVFPSSIPSCTEDWGNPPTVPSTPAARETYSGLAYVQHLDKMWLFGGALGTSGCRSTGMWMLDLPTLTWQRMDPTNGTQETVYTDINYADYDPQTKLVYVYIANNDVLASYNPDTNTMTELLNHNSYGVGAYSNGVLDPKRHLFVILGAGFAGSYDLTTTPPTFRKFSSQTVGCNGIQGPNYPGLAYDPVQDKIVGWAGGNTVYLFDTPTLTCTAVTYPGGPPAQQTNGTYGRWRYFPVLNVFALVNDWKQNAYTLRLTPAP